MKYISMVVVTLFLCIANSLFAETVQISVQKDNTLYFSQSGSLSNGSGSYIFVGDTAARNGSSERRAVIAFDIASIIPDGATITGVQLSLNMSKTISGIQSIALHRLLSDWGEGSSNAGGEEGGGAIAAAGDATWIHRFSPSTLWDNAGGDFSAAVSASLSVGGTGIYTWGTTATMVSDVQMWLNMPSTNFGWILTGPDTSASAKRFNSREHPTVSSRPVLTVDYDLPVTVKNLIYPHVASNGTWETEIAVINTNDTQLTGKMVAYGNNGQKTGEEISIALEGRGRRQITIGNEFSNPNSIGYAIFESNSDDVVGYTKFFIEGRYRAALPAVDSVNSGNLFVSHVASTDQWWTGLSLINATDAVKIITFTFDNGVIQQRQFSPKEHRAFTIRSMFGGIAQPNIGSCVITDAEGFVGLELFGSMDLRVEKYFSGILLKDDTVLTMYYPHVASDTNWWTGIVAYNPPGSITDITVTPFAADGTVLPLVTVSVASGKKFIGTATSLGLPTDTAWFRLDATNPVTGFELFGTNNGNQLAGYTGVNIFGKTGVFAKKETDGWTGIAIVNLENSIAILTLTAYDDGGTVIANQVIPLDSFEKVVDLAENFFSSDISEATYISYTSDKLLVGFQLNGSSDDMLFDGLPGLMVSEGE